MRSGRREEEKHGKGVRHATIPSLAEARAMRWAHPDYIGMSVAQAKTALKLFIDDAPAGTVASLTRVVEGFRDLVRKSADGG